MLKTNSVFNNPICDNGITQWKTLKEIIEVPMTLFDSVGDSRFDCLEDYVGNPENLGFFGLLAKGYLYKKCKEDFGHTNCEEKSDYISDFLKSNDSYKIRRDNGEQGFINCYLYTYLPGKCGCHLMLGLAEGSRRFGAAYFSYLIGKYPLKTIPCKLTIEHLDKRLVKKKS
ncbi:hypothetical protein [Desulfurobacterium crinifex]